MSKIDFNIDNYNFEEIIDILGSEPNKVSIESSANKLIIKMLNEEKKNIANFIKKAKEKAILLLNDNSEDEDEDEDEDEVVDEELKIDIIKNINPLDTKTIAKIFSIDSIFRDIDKYPNSNNFIYELPNSIENVISMRLVSAEIPNVQSMFSKDLLNNNTFEIIMYYGFYENLMEFNKNVEKLVITIPNGSPSFTSLINTINKQLDSQRNSFSFLKSGINEVSGKFYFRFKTLLECKDWNTGYYSETASKTPIDNKQASTSFKMPTNVPGSIPEYNYLKAIYFGNKPEVVREIYLTQVETNAYNMKTLIENISINVKKYLFEKNNIINFSGSDVEDANITISYFVEIKRLYNPNSLTVSTKDRFYIDDIETPDLILYKNIKYHFVQQHNSNVNHQIHIDGSSNYNTGTVPPQIQPLPSGSQSYTLPPGIITASEIPYLDVSTNLLENNTSYYYHCKDQGKSVHLHGGWEGEISLGLGSTGSIKIIDPLAVTTISISFSAIEYLLHTIINLDLIVAEGEPGETIKATLTSDVNLIKQKVNYLNYVDVLDLYDVSFNTTEAAKYVKDLDYNDNTTITIRKERIQAYYNLLTTIDIRVKGLQQDIVTMTTAGKLLLDKLEEYAAADDVNTIFTLDTISRAIIAINILNPLLASTQEIANLAVAVSDNAKIAVNNILSGINEQTILTYGSLVSLKHTNGLQFEINFNPNNIDIKRSVGWLLGYRNTYRLNKIITYLDSYEKDAVIYYGYYSSDTAYGDNRQDYFYLYIDDFVGNYSDSINAANNKSYLGNSLLARIQMNAPLYSKVFDTPGSGMPSLFLEKERKYFGPVNIRKLHIKLIDSYGNLLDFGNTNYALTFQFERNYSQIK